MIGQWEIVDAPPPYAEGYAWAGLLIVHAYDLEDGLLYYDKFEVWHRATGELILEINSYLERAQEIAADLANLADWESLSTTDEMMLQAKIMAFGAGYPGEVVVYNDWAVQDDLGQIVPYR